MKLSLWAFLGPLSLSLLAGCADFQRSRESGYSTPRSPNAVSANNDRMTQQSAYEMGKDPNSLTAQDLSDIRSREKVRQLERTLGSRKEQEQYSKVLPWFANDEEKIAFLSIPTLEGRQQWINSKGIWNRAQVPQAEMKQIVEAQDIMVGMPGEYVKRSWGEPVAVEVSGNPIYKNERWKYQRFVSGSEGYRKETRYVYFEGGRVVGWETQ